MLTRLRNSRITSTLDEFAALEVRPLALAATILVSTALGLAALVFAQRMVVIAFAVVLPWIPILLIKLRADWKTYSWLAFFEFVVIFQLAHFAEHLSQMIELHYLSWAPILAKGIISQLDAEPVHFWWNLSILFCVTLLLLLRYRRNTWLWASWLFSIWHQVEHTYIYFTWFLPQGISNHPGIFGAGGVADEAGLSIPYLTTMGRPDLHFWYNFFEIGLFVIAFVWQAARVFHPAPGVRRLGFKRQNAFALLAAGQVAVVTLIALVHYSPATLNVPRNYPTIQAAIDVAPDWAIIRVAPGVYHEALNITKPLSLVGSGRGMTVIKLDDDSSPVITVHKTHDVSIKTLTVQGGLYGILIDFSKTVQVLSSAVQDSSLVGIRAVSSLVDVEYSEISHVRSPYGMGIELANTVNSGESMIVHNTVHDIPQAGIDLHNSNAMIDRNSTEHNGACGMMIAEMSMAMLNSNQIRGNADCGIHVVDQSMAQMSNNRVEGTTPGPLGSADGIKAEYNAEIMLRSNTIDAAPGHDVVLMSDASIEPWQ